MGARLSLHVVVESPVARVLCVAEAKARRREGWVMWLERLTGARRSRPGVAKAPGLVPVRTAHVVSPPSPDRELAESRDCDFPVPQGPAPKRPACRGFVLMTAPLPPAAKRSVAEHRRAGRGG